jgi:hypothetical protein
MQRITLFGQNFIELSEEKLYCGYCSKVPCPLFENRFSMELGIYTLTYKARTCIKCTIKICRQKHWLLYRAPLNEICPLPLDAPYSPWTGLYHLAIQLSRQRPASS